MANQALSQMIKEINLLINTWFMLYLCYVSYVISVCVGCVLNIGKCEIFPSIPNLWEENN